jgi:hypothetical protein
MILPPPRHLAAPFLFAPRLPPPSRVLVVNDRRRKRPLSLPQNQVLRRIISTHSHLYTPSRNHIFPTRRHSRNTPLFSGVFSREGTNDHHPRKVNTFPPRHHPLLQPTMQFAAQPPVGALKSKGKGSAFDALVALEEDEEQSPREEDAR